MRLPKILNRLLQMVMIATYLLTTANVFAAEHASQNLSVIDYLTDKDGKYTGPTVEDNITVMDTDKNGFADVSEVRAFLEEKHGKSYQKDLLDRWQLSASGRSCGLPPKDRMFQ